MKNGKTVRRLVWIMTLCATLLFFAMAACADTPPEFQFENAKVMNHCDVEIDGNTIVVTDTDFNEDVWDSKFLIDAGVELEPGDSIVVPSNMPHGTVCLEKGALLDVFTPERQDFLK